MHVAWRLRWGGLRRTVLSYGRKKITTEKMTKQWKTRKKKGRIDVGCGSGCYQVILQSEELTTMMRKDMMLNR